jgi:bifunctional pyridoxal-dependent enzyme with beta-cystathionase and maltose regulon repressor activities
MAEISKEVEDCTITIMTQGKTYNVAGLETSVVIISNPDLMKKMQTFQQSMGRAMVS